MKTLFIVLFIVVSAHVSDSQWVFDSYLPHSQVTGGMGVGIASIVDSTTSWVSGKYLSNGVIYLAKRNLNGWKEITDYDIDPTADPSAISARDSNHAWLGTFTNPRIFYTSNGGTNWILQAQFPVSQNNRICGIAFSKQFPEIGYVFTNKGNYEGIFILKTKNGGLNWVKDSLNIPGYTGMIASISVIDSTHAWFGLLHNCNNCYESKIAMTTSGGQNWNIIDVYSLNDPDYIQFSENKSDGIYVNTDINIGQSVVYRTTNSGLNWSPAYYFTSPYYAEDVKWVYGTSTIYLSNVTDRVKRSTNAGITWTNMNPIFYYPPLTGIDAVKINSSTIYALGFIGKTNDYEPQVYKLLDTVHVIGIESLGTIVPNEFILFQNYPNPFNPGTTIRFDLPKDGRLNIEIFDVLGRVVTSLAKDEFKSAGSYKIDFDGSNYPSGLYFYKITCGDFSETRKMILLK